MNRAGLTDRLIAGSINCSRHFAGGLSHVTIGASIIFAGMTGAAVTDCVAIGNILIPGMKRDGYPAPYAAAVTAAASIIGPIIPPSIIMIGLRAPHGSVGHYSVFGRIHSGPSHGGLPACHQRISIGPNKFPKKEKRASLREILHETGHAALALLTPAIILGSALSGVATVTDQPRLPSAMSFSWDVRFQDPEVERPHTHRPLHRQTDRSRISSLATANIFGWYVTRLGIPEHVNNAIHVFTSNPYTILFLVNIFCFLSA